MTTTAQLFLGRTFSRFPKEWQDIGKLQKYFDTTYCVDPEDICETEVLYGYVVVDAMESWKAINWNSISSALEARESEFIKLVGVKPQLYLTPSKEEY